MQQHKRSEYLTAIAIIFLAAALYVAMAVLYWFGAGGSESRSAYGQFGDFLGGVLNPLIGAVTLCALVWTVKAQSETLRLTQEALRHAKEEALLEAERSEQQLLELQRANAAAMAEQTYKAVLEQTERVLAQKVHPWGHQTPTVSFLDVVNGSAPIWYLDWWMKTPTENRDQQAKFLTVLVGVNISHLVTAAAQVKAYWSDTRWGAEKRRVLVLLVMAVSIEGLGLFEAQRLCDSIEGGNLGPWQKEFEMGP